MTFSDRTPGEVHRLPMYARLLRLKHLAPSGFLCFAFLEGALALGILLALAELVSWWGVLILPALVAVMVKLNDVVAGLVARPVTPSRSPGAVHTRSEALPHAADAGSINRSAAARSFTARAAAARDGLADGTAAAHFGYAEGAVAGGPGFAGGAAAGRSGSEDGTVVGRSGPVDGTVVGRSGFAGGAAAGRSGFADGAMVGRSDFVDGAWAGPAGLAGRGGAPSRPGSAAVGSASVEGGSAAGGSADFVASAGSAGPVDSADVSALLGGPGLNTGPLHPRSRDGLSRPAGRRSSGPEVQPRTYPGHPAPVDDVTSQSNARTVDLSAHSAGSATVTSEASAFNGSPASGQWVEQRDSPQQRERQSASRHYE